MKSKYQSSPVHHTNTILIIIKTKLLFSRIKLAEIKILTAYCHEQSLKLLLLYASSMIFINDNNYMLSFHFESHKSLLNLFNVISMIIIFLLNFIISYFYVDSRIPISKITNDILLITLFTNFIYTLNIV